MIHIYTTLITHIHYILYKYKVMYIHVYTNCTNTVLMRSCMIHKYNYTDNDISTDNDIHV